LNTNDVGLKQTEMDASNNNNALRKNVQRQAKQNKYWIF